MDQRPRFSVLRPPALRLQRPYTDTDLRRQQQMLRYGCTWEEQDEIPVRPWSAATERFCEDTRRQVEMEDWEAEQERRTM